MASNTVCFNGKTAVHKDSGGTLISSPDVCLTPIGKSSVPIPYTNIAKSSDADKTASSVKVNGNPVCHKDSTFSKSTGDEAGSDKGIISGTTTEKAEFITASSNVFVEGVPVVRMGDQMVSNNKNSAPAPLQQAGANTPSIEELTALTAQPVPSRHKLALEVAGADMKGLKGELIAEDADGKTHHLALGRTTWAEKHRRQLFFENLQETNYLLSLMFQDNKFGNYKIPLGRDLTVCEKTEEKGEWETVLIPVIPRCHRNYVSNKFMTSYPRKGGWIYIFKDGYLWRETHVIDGVISGQLRDVNLTYLKGKDERPATVTVAESRVVLPYQIGGDCPDIEMCYSEVQWSWEYIQKMGGMDPEDIRHNHGPQVDPCPDEGEARNLRSQRLQYIDLSSYPEFPEKQRDDEWVVKNWRENNSSKVHHLTSHQNSKIPVVILKDPLGVAHKMADGISKYTRKLADLIESLKTGVKPGTEEDKTNLTREDIELRNKIKAQFELASVMYQVGFATDENKEKYGDDLNKPMLREILGVDKRKEIRQVLAKRKEQLYKYIREVQFEAYEAALDDYYYNTPDRLLEGKGCITYHQQCLRVPPYRLDRHLDLQEDYVPYSLAQDVKSLQRQILYEENKSGKVLMKAAESKSFDALKSASAILNSLVDTFSGMASSKIELLEQLTIAINSIRGRGIPMWEVIEVTHDVPTVPKGYKTVPGSARIEIVEKVSQAIFKDAGADQSTHTTLTRTGLNSDQSLPQRAPSTRHYQVLPEIADMAATGTLTASSTQVRLFQIAEKTKFVAAAAKNFKASNFYLYGFQGFFGALEAINMSTAIHQLQENNFELREILNVSGAIASAGGFGLGIKRDLLAHLVKAKAFKDTGKLIFKLNVYAAAVSTAISFWDSLAAIQDEDLDAAAAHGAAGAVGIGITVAVFVGAGAAIMVPLFILGFGLMVLAEYLKDDPLEKFAKKGLFQQDTPFTSQPNNIWASITNLALQPTVDSDYKKWRDIDQARHHVMDYLFHYDTEMSITWQYGSLVEAKCAMSCHALQRAEMTYLPQYVHVSCTFRKFHHQLSVLETPPLRVYLNGLGGHYLSLAPTNIDRVDNDDKTMVQEIKLTYQIPTEIHQQLTPESLFLFHSRQQMNKETELFIPTPNLKEEARYHAVCKQAIKEQNAHQTQKHPHEKALAKRTGTLVQITSLPTTMEKKA